MMHPMSSQLCPQCGRPLDAHDRHVRFRLPDPVASTAEKDAAAETWMSHGDPNSSVMMQVPNVGPFVRCLLPVHLTGGFTVTFGVWLAVHPDDLQRAARTWWEPDYSELVLDGYLANALPVFDLLGAPAHARVLNEEHTPVVTSSSDPSLSPVLTEQHAHELLLAALPG